MTQSTSLSGIEKQERRASFYHMAQSSPIQQAEVIAKHYVAHANLALNLLELLEKVRHFGYSENSMSVIKMMVDQITTNHMHDFGIKLEWPTEDAAR